METQASVKRILYIEDSLTSQWLLKKQFKLIGEVVVAASLVEARAVLKAQTFDLIIADWSLPDGETLEVVHELRQKQDALHLPVIMVSASMDSLLTVMALRSGANECFAKPIVWVELLKVAGRMLTAPYIRAPQVGQIPVTWVEGTANGRWWLYCPEISFFMEGVDADVIRAQATERVREVIAKGTPMPFVSKVKVSQRLI